MNVSGIFVDTNILVYAHDAQAGDRHARAKQRLAQLWSGESLPGISIQVLQEFYVNLVRKGVPDDAAQATVTDYLQWEVVDGDADLLVDGMALCRRWQLSLWDALIIAAARRSGANTVWSEDFNTGQDYGGVTVVNPLT